MVARSVPPIVRGSFDFRNQILDRGSVGTTLQQKDDFGMDQGIAVPYHHPVVSHRIRGPLVMDNGILQQNYSAASIYDATTNLYIVITIHERFVKSSDCYQIRFPKTHVATGEIKEWIRSLTHIGVARRGRVG